MKKRPKVIRLQTTKRQKKPRMSKRSFLLYMGLCIALILIARVNVPEIVPEIADPGTIREAENSEGTQTEGASRLTYEDIPEYSGSIYCEINGNKPGFSDSDRERLAGYGYEYYSALDELGRCGYAEACVGPETQPEGEERGDIYTVHPSGWRSGQGWERCHLIAWALTGENANDHNLVTGTHAMNVDGMLPFEIEIAEAADRGLHVMYRVTPVYNGPELICRGVHMEAESIEDENISFNIFIYNVEEGKTIDYVAGFIK